MKVRIGAKIGSTASGRNAFALIQTGAGGSMGSDDKAGHEKGKVAASSEDAWSEFLNRYYWDQASSFVCEYPDGKSFFIDFADIDKYNLDIGQELLDHPDEVLRHAGDALSGMSMPTEADLSGAYIRIHNLPELTPIREIRSAHINTLIAVTGLVRKATEVRPMITTGAFRCVRCGFVTMVSQEEGYTQPFECDNDTCGRKGPFKLVNESSTFIDFQKIRIQDAPDEVRPGEQPQTLDVLVKDDLTGRVSPGNHIIIVGILRSRQRIGQSGKSTAFDLLLEAISIEVLEKGFEEIELTEADELSIIELGKDSTVYGKMIGSIAPSIYGYEEVKEAIVLQLFGGLPKESPDKLSVRGDIHVLLVGDPGVAKSQFLRYAKMLAPRGVLTNGRGSSTAGLTAAVVKDNGFSDGRFTLEAGALVLADKGLLCSDELDKVEESDRSALHEAMASQTITINKAGINTTLKARCSILAAANPKLGRFDRYEPVSKQINLEPTLLSRFDLIFVTIDEPVATRDAAITQHIFNTHIAGELLLHRMNVRNSGITEEQIINTSSTIKPVIDSDFLRKYIAYSKKYIFPLIQPDARDLLSSFYMGLRGRGYTPDTPLPVTARQLEALIRLAEASARTRLSNEATMEDAKRVIRIVETSLNQSMTDPETGELDSDLVNTGIGKSQRSRMKMIKQAIKMLQGSNGSSVPMDLIIQTLEGEGMKEELVRDAIDRLKRSGDVLEVSNNKYRLGR